MRPLFNKLYVKIFLWFWLTLAATFALLAGLSSMSFSELSYEPLRGGDAHYLKRLGHAIERSANKHDISAEQLINHGRFAKRKQLYLYSVDQDKALQNFTSPHDIGLNELNFRQSMAPQMIFHEHFQALGPLLITLPDGQYQLYELRPGRKLPWLLRLKLMPTWLKVVVALGASLLLSLLFTRTLITPVNALRSAAKDIAAGNLQSRAPSNVRHDELGVLTDEFNAMAARLETLVNSQRSLLGDISHELRSPLTRLSLACALAQDSADSATLLQLQRIEKEAKQLDTLIARILMLSRLENRQQSIVRQRITVRELLAPVFADAKFEADSEHKQLSLAELSDSHFLNIDPQVVASACDNLLRNAIKYANQHIEVSLQWIDTIMLLSISDDGPGVAEHELAHLKEPFYRVGSARSRDSGGTGLGLAIANKAIAAHNGELVLQNNPQGGLVATIKLPTT